jgi:hypothetical protein
MESKELCRIFKVDRGELPQFLKINCKYDYLKNLLSKIEEDHYSQEMNTKDINILYSLFVGYMGNESNKQRAIYELPTEELLIILKYICDFLNIKHVEEIGAGQGLLSHMLQHHLGDDYTVVASDGRWAETSYRHKYYNVIKKLFLSYCLDDINFDDKLLVISWADKDITDLHKLLELKTPKNLVIIGYSNDNYIFHLREKLKNLGYTGATIPVKQLCYRDYFHNNKYYPDESCVSSLMFMTKNEEDPDILNKLLLNIKLRYSNCLSKKVGKITDKFILQDIIVNYIGNYYLINSLDNEERFKKLYKYCLRIMKKSTIVIPTYLEKYKEFIFWSVKSIKDKYPLQILSREKFIEYMELINTLDGENGLENLKENGYMATWIGNNDDAEKYLWLDFSHKSKKWKETYNSFLLAFGTVYSHNESNSNSFVGFASII